LPGVRASTDLERVGDAPFYALTAYVSDRSVREWPRRLACYSRGISCSSSALPFADLVTAVTGAHSLFKIEAAGYIPLR
jgi:hypothetical protein